LAANEEGVTVQPSFHLLGLGGAGMSPLAELLLQRGYRVSGSDQKQSATLERLASLGATTFVGHAAEQVPEQAIVVASTAVKANNPEFAIAAERGQTLWHRSQLLAFLLQSIEPAWQATVGVSGTHGKTTITGMVGSMLKTAGAEPTVIAGGRLPQSQSNLWAPEGSAIAVAELDESDGSIVRYQPSVTILANLELDHADHYSGGEAQLMATFTTFVQGLESGSQDSPRQLILNANCPMTRQLAAQVPESVELHWLKLETETPWPEAIQRGQRYELRWAKPNALGGWQGEVVHLGSNETQPKSLGALSLQVPGQHNLSNAAMALLAGALLKQPLPACVEGLNGFTGMGRRFELRGEVNGACLIDDYGHHPTEVEVTLNAARTWMQARNAASGHQGKLTVVFQPHRYSRLATFLPGFAQALSLADAITLLPVYSAGEAPSAGVSSTALLEAMQALELQPKVALHEEIPPFTALQAQLLASAQPGDVLLSMGAGDVTQLWA
jgi:UDP-N-acetylmuramate--alanine ligase